MFIQTFHIFTLPPKRGGGSRRVEQGEEEARLDCVNKAGGFYSLAGRMRFFRALEGGRGGVF